MSGSQRAKNYIITLTSCFILTAVLAVLIFAKLRIYPGGKFTILTFDLAAQHLPFITSLRYIGSKDSSIMFSMLGGLGINNLSQFSYYMISPFYLFTTFVPLESLPDAIYFITIIRLGLCSVSFCTYVLYGLRHHNDRYIVVLLSTAYALSSYNVFYSMCVNFFDVIILLPVMLIGIEELIRGKKGGLYVITLTLSLYCNYYIAYMSGIFLCFYLIYRLIALGRNRNEFIGRIRSFICLSVLSLGLSMPLLFPTLKYMTMGKLTETADHTTTVLRVTPIRILRNILPAGEFFARDGGAPQLYCTVLAIILIIVFFTAKNIRRKEKIAAATVFSVYFISFMLTPIDRIWHGFRDPECFPARYAFTCICFMLVIAIRALETDSLENIRVKTCRKKTLAISLSTLVLSGLYINGTSAIMEANHNSFYLLHDSYINIVTDISRSLAGISDPDLFRTVSANPFSSIDGLMFGYNDVGMFSSAYNSELHGYFKSMGLRSVDQTLKTDGITPVMESILAVKYRIGSEGSFYNSEYVAGDNPRAVYKNPDALPIGYLADISSTPIEDGEDPFINQDNLISRLLGQKTTIYQSNDIFVNDVPDREYARSSAIECDILHDGPVYVYFPPGSAADKELYDINTTITVYNWDYVRKAESIVAVNGNAAYSFNEDRCSKIVYIGDYKQGDRIILQACSTAYYKDPIIVTMDVAEYKHAVRKLSIHPLTVTSHGAGIIEGTVTGVPGKSLVISLPYMSGYNIIVDGKKTAYGCYNPAMISVNIPEGDHNIRISYQPPGLMAGCVIGIFSLALLLWSVYGIPSSGRRNPL